MHVESPFRGRVGAHSTPMRSIDGAMSDPEIASAKVGRMSIVCSLRRTPVALGVLMAVTTPLSAHGPADVVPTLATAWSLAPAYLLPPVLLVVFYALGLARLWHRAGVGRGVGTGAVAAFVAGVLALFLAVVWPLDAYGEWSLGAHMAQHMVLLAVVPPLLLAGQPVAVVAQALPRRWLRPLHTVGASTHALLLASLAGATLAHSAVMWLWHLPAATTAALNHEGIHVLMHASFLLAGLWFWSALIRCVREPSTGVVPALVALVAIMMQMGLLGALLTFSPRVLFPIYIERATALGMEPLVDQQLAGLIMWVPACLPYLGGALWLLASAFRRQAGH